MSELSRDEALVAAAVIASKWYDGHGADGEESIRLARQALAKPAIRSALTGPAGTGGGGGEKADWGKGDWAAPIQNVLEITLPIAMAVADKEKQRADTLASRLAAAEKRAEEAERNQSTTTRCRDAERERDALKAELAEAKTALLRERERRESSRDERDAALARVKELEAKQSSSVHIDMAGIYVDGVKYTPEQVRSVVRRLATIRDAAGAQP